MDMKILYKQAVAEQINSEQMLTALEGFASIRHIYSSAVKEITTKLEILDEEFHTRFDHNPIHHIESRLKSPISIARKLEKKGYDISIASATKNLQDIAGVRIICHYLEDVYRMADMLLGQSDVTLIVKKDYIKNPKPNGYRSLHLTVSVPVFLSDCVKDVPVEVQIRTIGMDFWASLDHELRYKAHSTPDDAVTRLRNCAEEMARLDREMQSVRSLCIKD